MTTNTICIENSSLFHYLHEQVVENPAELQVLTPLYGYYLKVPIEKKKIIMSYIVSNNLDEQIINYLPMLDEQQKKTILTIIKTFTDEQKDWWTEISEEQQLAIDHSLAEMKAGKRIPHNEVIKRYQK
jgi:predicted transcriptional regulator